MDNLDEAIYEVSMLSNSPSRVHSEVATGEKKKGEERGVIL